MNAATKRFKVKNQGGGGAISAVLWPFVRLLMLLVLLLLYD